MPAANTTSTTAASALNLSSSMLLGGSDVSGPSLIHCRNPTQVRDAVFHLVHKGTFLPHNNPFRSNNNNGTPSPSPSSSCGFAADIGADGSSGVHSTPPPHLPPRSPLQSPSSAPPPPLEKASFVVLLPLPSKYPQEPVSRHNPVDALLLLHEDTECVVRIDIQYIVKRYGGAAAAAAATTTTTAITDVNTSSASCEPVRDHPLAPLLHLLGDHTIIKVMHDGRGLGDAIRSDVQAFDEVVVEPIVDTCLLPMYFGFVDSYAPRTQRGVVKIPSLSSTLRFFGLPGLAVPPHLYPENGVGNAPTAVVFSKGSTSSKRSSRRTSPVLSPVKSPCPVERTFSNNSSIASKDAQATPTKAPRARTITSANNSATTTSNNFARPPPLPPMPSSSAPQLFSTPPPLSKSAASLDVTAATANVTAASRRSTSPVISTTNTVPMLTAYQHCYLSSLQMIFNSQFTSNEILSSSFTRAAIIYREATQEYFNSIGGGKASSSSAEDGTKKEVAAASDAGSSSSTPPPVLKAQSSPSSVAAPGAEKRRQPTLPPPDSSAPLQSATEEIVAASMRYFNILSSYAYRGLADDIQKCHYIDNGDDAAATHLRSLLHYKTPNYLPYGVLLPLGCSSKILPTTTQNIGGEYKLDADAMTVDAMQLRSHSDHLIASVDSATRESTLKSRMAVSAALAFSEAMGISSQASSPNRIIIACHNLQIVGHNKFSSVKKRPHMVSFNDPSANQQHGNNRNTRNNNNNNSNKKPPKLLMKIPEKLLKAPCQVGPIVRRCQGCYLPYEYFPIAVNLQGGFGLDAARGVITATCLGCVERGLPCEFFRRGICVRSCGCCSEPTPPSSVGGEDALSSQKDHHSHHHNQHQPLLVPSCDYRHVLQPCPVGRQCTVYVKEMAQDVGTLLSVSTTGSCPYTHEGLVKKVAPCAVGTPLACHKAPNGFPPLIRGEFNVIISKAFSMPLPPMPPQQPPAGAKASTNGGTPQRPSSDKSGNNNTGKTPPTSPTPVVSAPLTAERLHAHQEQTRLECNTINNLANNNHSRPHSVGCGKSQGTSSNANRVAAAVVATAERTSSPITSILKAGNHPQPLDDAKKQNGEEEIATDAANVAALMVQVDDDSDVNDELVEVIHRASEGGNLPSYENGTDGTETATPSRASSSALSRRKRRGKGHKLGDGDAELEGGAVPTSSDKANSVDPPTKTPAAPATTATPSTPPVRPTPFADPTARLAPTVSSAKGGSSKMPHSPSVATSTKRHPSGGDLAMGCSCEGAVVADVDAEVSLLVEKHSHIKGSSSTRGSATPSSCVSSSAAGGGVNGTRRRRRRIHQAHKTAMAAVEAGQDIPPSCLAILNAHGRPLPDKDVWYFDGFEEGDAINGEDALHYCSMDATSPNIPRPSPDAEDHCDDVHTDNTKNDGEFCDAFHPMTPPTAVSATTTLPHCVSDDVGSRSGRGVTFSLMGQGDDEKDEKLDGELGV